MFFTFNQRWFYFLLLVLLVLIGTVCYLLYARLGPTQIIGLSQTRINTDASIKPGEFTIAPIDGTGAPVVFFRSHADKYLYTWSPFSKDAYGNTLKVAQYGDQTAPTS